jgi:hypothetical protein
MNGTTRRNRIILCLTLAVPFTAVMVHYSLNHGPLLLMTRFDDISYFVDGLSRLQAMWKTIVHAGALQPSAIGVVRGYAAQPPKSGFSTFLAFFSFAILGVHDWAPYAGNGVTLLALLAVTDWLLDGLTLWQRAICLLIVLTVPISGLFIVEFRPDLPAALLTVLFIVMALRQPVMEMSWQKRVLLGASLGAAIWVKPTVFPITLGLGAAAMALAVIRDSLTESKLQAPARFAAAFGQIAAPAILLPLPHFLVAGNATTSYIWENVFGANKQVWISHSGMTDASTMTHLLWYLTGPGGVVTLGVFLLIAPPILLLGAFLVNRTRSRRETITLCCYAAMVLLAYLIPAINWQKQVFLGSVFYLLILAGLMVSLRVLWLRWRRWGAAIVLAALLCGTLGFVWPENKGNRADPKVIARNGVIEQIYAAIRADLPSGQGKVFLTFVGNVNQDVLELEALKDGITDYDIRALPLSADPDDYRQRYDENDLVLASDPGNPETEIGFPSTAFLATSLAMIRARTDYHLVASFATHEGFHYYLFAKY